MQNNKNKKNDQTVRIRIEQAAPTRKKLTKDVLIEFIIDETGSMEQYREDVIGGYNRYLADQRAEKLKGRCYWSLTKFNSGHVSRVSDRADIDNVIGLDRYSYRPGGSTNLYDAVGYQLSRLLRDKEELRDTSVMIVVFTDGYENCSREYKYDHIRDLIRKCEAEGWAFIYMGANQDAWEVGESIGISNHLNTRSFSMAQTEAAFNRLSTSTMAYRANVAVGIQTSASAYNFFDPATEGMSAGDVASQFNKTGVVINNDITVEGDLKVKGKMVVEGIS